MPLNEFHLGSNPSSTKAPHFVLVRFRNTVPQMTLKEFHYQFFASFSYYAELVLDTLRNWFQYQFRSCEPQTLTPRQGILSY